MNNSTPNDRRAAGNRRPSSQRRGPNQRGTSRGRAQGAASGYTAGPEGDSRSRRGTLTTPDTGYSLHSRRVRRGTSGGGGIISSLLRPRMLLFVLILALVAVVLIVGISSCVRRYNEAETQRIEDAKPKNEADERVAPGVSAKMTARFTVELDRGEKLAQIAQNADQYDGEVRLLTLALSEPEAIDFVAAYPTSDKASRPYDKPVERGVVPQLYDWDEHWGAINYGNGPMAVTGSGPTTLAMAYMGLTGKTDFTPAEIARQGNKSNVVGGDSGSKVVLFTKMADAMGLTADEYTPSSDTLLYGLGTNTLFAVELKENTLTEETHWALVVSLNEDGSLTVYDPTSTSVSNHPWNTSIIANASNTFVAISITDDKLAQIMAEEEAAAEAQTTEDEDDAEAGTATEGASDLSEQSYATTTDDASYDESYDTSGYTGSDYGETYDESGYTGSDYGETYDESGDYAQDYAGYGEDEAY